MQDFAEQMRSLGAREFQVVALSADEDRAMAAVAEAQRRGVTSVIPYALTLFDDPSWTPKDSRPPQKTNLSVDRKCAHCGGDRFVAVTDDVTQLYGETYAPCKVCNPQTNTARWLVTGERLETQPR
jgi:hypothetical protein